MLAEKVVMEQYHTMEPFFYHNATTLAVGYTG